MPQRVGDNGPAANGSVSRCENNANAHEWRNGIVARPDGRRRRSLPFLDSSHLVSCSGRVHIPTLRRWARKTERTTLLVVVSRSLFLWRHDDATLAKAPEGQEWFHVASCEWALEAKKALEIFIAGGHLARILHQ